MLTSITYIRGEINSVGERGINVGHIFVDELEFHTLKTDGCVVVKKSSFLPQTVDENKSRHQKKEFSASKR